MLDDNPFLRAKRDAERNDEARAAAAISGDIRNMKDWVSILTEAIQAGAVDDVLPQLTEAIQNRKESRREEVLKLVKETFGEDARVVVKPITTTSQGVPLDSLRIANTTDGVPDEAEAPTAETDGAKPDALAHLDEVEARMESEDSADPNPTPTEHPPERRGAVISGLHPSDMGD